MAKILASEQEQTRLRGLLYQVYHTGSLNSGRRHWQFRIGSITYPDRSISVKTGKPRGWVSALFIHAAALVRDDPKQWLEVLVLDETQQPDAGQLATILKTVTSFIAATPK